jgi:hypothetical protein
VSELVSADVVAYDAAIQSMEEISFASLAQ